MCVCSFLQSYLYPQGTENIFPLAFDASITVDVGVGTEQPNAEKQKAIVSACLGVILCLGDRSVVV